VSQFFKMELTKWFECPVKRIVVPFDRCDTLVPVLLGELIPRFGHAAEFAAERLAEIAE
jgi:hypothetical protein